MTVLELDPQQAAAPAGVHGSGSARRQASRRNVANGERVASLAASSLLAAIGLSRGNLPGLLLAGVGGGLLVRGASGRCPMYQALGVDTAHPRGDTAEAAVAAHGIHVEQAYLINRPASELYAFWRNFTNLPTFMRHLERVEIVDERHSRWVAKAPRVAGGTISWDAEITRDEPGSLIAWHSLPGSRVITVGEIRFSKALGDRGTEVRVSMEYIPPIGRLGHWVATLFGESPRQQMHDDLRDFKRLMELGEIPTTTGQSRGTCLGHGTRST